MKKSTNMKKSTDNACCCWDFRMSAYQFTINERVGSTGDPPLVNETIIINFLEKHCKKFCFQLEKGEENGYLHYQGRLSLKIKLRNNGIVKLFQDHLQYYANLSRTSTMNMDNFYYVEKDDTRIAGPWRDSDNRIPRQYAGEIEERPWQVKIMSMIDVFDPRGIHVVVDPEGLGGKSTVVGRYCCRGLAERIPVQKDSRDIMRMILNVEDIAHCKMYFIDLPRAAEQKNLSSMYAAIEMIKDGYCYDDRYKFRRKWFDSPQIVVFCNEAPPVEFLSKDRWIFHTINHETWDLEPFQTPTKTKQVTATAEVLRTLTTGNFRDRDLNIIPDHIGQLAINNFSRFSY
nr:MAG: replication associated protein [Cressdnaviricota sp.]